MSGLSHGAAPPPAGLANKKTVAITAAGEGLSVSLATTKTKKSSQPALAVNTSVLKRDFRKMARAVVNQVSELLLSALFFNLQSTEMEF